MKNRCMESALACVGAVIGAGFVSGREVMSFFSRYGVHSWWLILVSALTMLALCTLCMRRASCRQGISWCELYRQGGQKTAALAQGYTLLLLSAVSGAMVSASGHIVSLLWAWEWAYSIGAVGTLVMVWFLSQWGVKQLSLISGLLTVLFLGMMVLILKNDAYQASVALREEAGLPGLLLAALSAAAYGAMNIAIAIGVICRAGQARCRANDRQAVLFSLLLVGLLFLSNYLYLKHPELSREALPVVKLFNGFGRIGYLLSAALLYLAIVTTLFAVIYALRGAIEPFVPSKGLAAGLCMGIPLAISTIGFTDIVEGWYMPIGLGCLAIIFLPLALQKKRSGS